MDNLHYDRKTTFFERIETAGNVAPVLMIGKRYFADSPSFPLDVRNGRRENGDSGKFRVDQQAHLSRRDGGRGLRFHEEDRQCPKEGVHR